MASTAHREVMDDLKAKLGAIAEHIPHDRPLVYLDYPMHKNVGDLLINLGTEQFFRDFGYNVTARGSIYDLALTHRPGRPLVDLKRLGWLDALVERDATLVFHGGGNVGDLYPNHQKLRETLLLSYPSARVVVLPQTVHFADPAEAVEARRVFAGHPRLTLFVRDEDSLRKAGEQLGISAMLMPDMAQRLWGMLRADPGPARIVINRSDAEATGHIFAPQPDDRRFDWGQLSNPLDNISQRVIAKLQTINRAGLGTGPLGSLWYWRRDRLIAKAMAAFQGSRAVATDRLHGTILGALLDRDVAFADNSYGKVSTYYRLWLSKSDKVSPA